MRQGDEAGLPLRKGRPAHRPGRCRRGARALRVDGAVPRRPPRVPRRAGLRPVHRHGRYGRRRAAWRRARCSRRLRARRRPERHGRGGGGEARPRKPAPARAAERTRLARGDGAALPRQRGSLDARLHDALQRREARGALHARPDAGAQGARALEPGHRANARAARGARAQDVGGQRARVVQPRRPRRLHALLPAEPAARRLGRHAAAYSGGACKVSVRLKVVKKTKRGERARYTPTATLSTLGRNLSLQ